MIRMVGIAVISSFAAFVLEKLGFGGTRLYLAFASLVMLIAGVEGLGTVIGSLTDIKSPSVATDVVGAALRVLGIGYIGGFFSDFCIELGAKSAADGLMLLTRVEIISVVMPYFTELLSLTEALLR